MELEFLGPGWLRYPRLDYRKDLDELPSRGLRTVRLLPPLRSRLQPSADTLQIEIVNYDLDKLSKRPEDGYDTLSYCWGSTRPFSRHRVIVQTKNGGCQMSIFTNLYLALTSIQGKGGSIRPIFADQICVNQKDDEEISRQVQLMGEIYSKCVKVVVWLGSGNAVSDSYFDFVESINGEKHPACELADLSPDDRLHVHDAAVDICKATPQRAHGSDVDLAHRLAQAVLFWKTCFPVAGYTDVLQRPWWGRLWIIQEAALAPDGVFLCGEKQAEFEHFRAAYFFYNVYCGVWIHYMHGKGVSRAAARLHDSIFDLVESYRRIFGQRYQIRPKTKDTLVKDTLVEDTLVKDTLVALVKKYNVNGDSVKIGATMPRDRILGLAGLSGDAGGVKEWKKKCVADVYTEFAKREVKKDVDILLFAQRDRCLWYKIKYLLPKTKNPLFDLSNLPSWVPDWSIDPLRTPYAYPRLASPPLSSAGGPIRGKLTVINRRTLVIKGLILGSIVRVGKKQVRGTWRRRTTEGVDYASLKHFFHEVGIFLDAAAALRGEKRHEEEETDNGTPSPAMLSFVDGGLTPLNYESPSTTALCNKLKKLCDIFAGAQEGRSFAGIWNQLRPISRRWVSVFHPLGLLQRIWVGIWVVIVLARVHLHIAFSALRIWWLRAPVRHAEGQGQSDGDADEHSSGEFHEFQDNIMRNRGRKLYVTNGGLVGLGPENMEIGDHVAVLFGGRIPFIVRKMTRPAHCVRVSGPSLYCTLVGEAYCQGMMKGEALVGKDLDEATTFFIS